MSQGRESTWADVITQYAAAMAFPIPITFYRGTGTQKYTKKRKRGQGDEEVLHFLKYTVGWQDISQTIGLMTEGTKESSVSKEYAESVCKEFEILGASGVTVFVASGDDGVGAGECEKLLINFPVSCT